MLKWSRQRGAAKCTHNWEVFTWQWAASENLYSFFLQKVRNYNYFLMLEKHLTNKLSIITMFFRKFTVIRATN